MTPWIRHVLVATLAGTAVSAPCSAAAQAPSPSRGQLLYATHCIECHDSQMHWRDQRKATDWPSLLAQVRQWQARAFLGWSDADIVEVTRHLNETIYRYPQPLEPVSLWRPR